MKMNALRPRRGPLHLLWVCLWGPLSLLSAFLPLAILNLLQFPSLLLLPFSRKAYRAWNRAIAYMVWGWWASTVQFMGTKLTISGDFVPDAEDAIVIANHQGMVDIVVLLCLAYVKRCVGDAKWMVKDVIKYVPGVGWGMLFLGCVFLKRNWADDEQNIRRTFRTYIDEKLPLWMVSFPEGTRVTPGKLAASQAYAKKAGLAPTNAVMLPRSKGFTASVQGLREHVKAIYSVTIAYADGRVPSLPELIRGEVDEIKIHIQRFPIASLPQDDATLSAWLLARFYEKDAWMGLQAPRPEMIKDMIKPVGT